MLLPRPLKTMRPTPTVAPVAHGGMLPVTQTPGRIQKADLLVWDPNY